MKLVLLPLLSGILAQKSTETAPADSRYDDKWDIYEYKPPVIEPCSSKSQRQLMIDNYIAYAAKFYEMDVLLYRLAGSARSIAAEHQTKFGLALAGLDTPVIESTHPQDNFDAILFWSEKARTNIRAAYSEAVQSFAAISVATHHQANLLMQPSLPDTDGAAAHFLATKMERFHQTMRKIGAGLEAEEQKALAQVKAWFKTKLNGRLMFGHSSADL